MSRKLKDFIDENRRAFDDELPSESAWQQIEKTINSQKKVILLSKSTIYKWSAAAAIFFILASGIYLLAVRKTERDNDTVKNTTTAPARGVNMDIEKIAPEFSAEAEKIYESIETQQQQLRKMAKEQPELYLQFAQDLAALDSSYRVLKIQAIQTPSREVLIRAMLQNLQLQAELLSKQLLIIHDFKNKKTNNNEKSNNRSI